MKNTMYNNVGIKLSREDQGYKPKTSIIITYFIHFFIIHIYKCTNGLDIHILFFISANFYLKNIKYLLVHFHFFNTKILRNIKKYKL